MHKNPKMHLVSRRGMMLYGASTMALGLLGMRMVNLQVFQAEEMLELAQKNRVDWKILLPRRGTIFDRNQLVLADSAIEYDLYLVSKLDEMPLTQIELLLGIISLSPQEYSAHQDQLLSNVARPLLLRRNLRREMLVKLEFQYPHLPRYIVRQQRRRHYTWGKDLAPISGYIGRPASSERRGENFELLDEFRLGKSGIEKYYERDLRGRSGRVAIKVDVRGRQLGELEREESIAGHDICLHVHAGLQRRMMGLLRGHRSASAVVMDARTGGVLALGSHPFYDANEMREALPVKRWKELINDPLKPMVNKAISGLYAPGSTLKPFVALAALQAGISPHQTHFCSGHIKLGKSRFHCWKHQGHGNIDMQGAIVQSCDVWFYQIALQLGIDRIADTIRQFGFGALTGIDLMNEKSGLVPDTAWKRRQFNQPFYQGETMIHAIGQGYTQATPLQLARSYAALINGGRLVEPRLFHFSRRQDAADDVLAQVLADLARTGQSLSFQSLDIDPRHFAVIRDSLINAVNKPLGTAWRSRLKKDAEGFLMAGKTGTTQVRRITPSERAQGVRGEDIAWHLRNHALFAGFAPVHQPRYVAVALIEHGVSGARNAAPLVRELFRALSAENLIG